jgi:hypothetical protein
MFWSTDGQKKANPISVARFKTYNTKSEQNESWLIKKKIHTVFSFSEDNICPNSCGKAVVLGCVHNHMKFGGFMSVLEMIVTWYWMWRILQVDVTICTIPTPPQSNTNLNEIILGVGTESSQNITLHCIHDYALRPHSSGYMYMYVCALTKCTEHHIRT